MIRAFVLLAAVTGCAGQERFNFKTIQPAEVWVELRMSSPGSDWAVRGREAAVAELRVDERPPHHLFIFSGPIEATYRIALGNLPPGKHQLTVGSQSNLRITAADFREISAGHAEYSVHANMPVLFIRKNTVGRFSDIPLLAYCGRLNENGQNILQYTVVFSNEDGGTSTRALMARWGRTTDIEYIYRAYPDKSTVQGPGHKEVEYTGKREGAHALLMPVTDNNMVAEASDAPMRFQLAPTLVSLDGASREQVMDDAPLTYLVAAKELEREGKLRPFGTQAGEKISDPRNYLYVEYKASHKNSAMAVAARLKNGRAYSSDLGRLDFTIWRDGWVRTAIELPPGSTRASVEAIELRCVVSPPAKSEPLAHSGRCRVERVNKVFFLDQQYAPGESFWKMETPVIIDSGQSAVFRP